jgi:predicted site-specific integrase-resolvase
MFGISEASVRENWIAKKKLEVNRTKTGRIRIHRDEIKRFAEETGRTIYWERN